VIGDVPPELPAAAEQHYPFAGFVVSGPAEALGKLERFAEEKGVTFEGRAASDGQRSLWLDGVAAFRDRDAMIEVMNKVQSGAFGDLRLGIVSDPRP
jgi:hypothetical protein